VQGHGSAAGFRPGDVFADNAADHNRKIARATRLTTPSALTVLRERSLSLIAKESSEGMRTSKDHGVTRQRFLGAESQTLETFNDEPQTDGAKIAARIEEFVRQSRNASKTNFPDDLPVAAIVLACLKHDSPLPPEIWRRKPEKLRSRK